MDMATSHDLVEGLPSRLDPEVVAVLIRERAVPWASLTSASQSFEMICSGVCRRPFGLCSPFHEDRLDDHIAADSYEAGRSGWHWGSQ